MELEKVKDDLSKMEGELIKKILSCRANVLFVDKVTPPLINVQTRSGFSGRCRVKFLNDDEKPNALA